MGRCILWRYSSLTDVPLQELWEVFIAQGQCVVGTLCTLLTVAHCYCGFAGGLSPICESFCAISKSLQAIYLKSVSGGSIMCFHGNVKRIRNELRDAYLSNYRKDNDTHICECKLYIKISQMNPWAATLVHFYKY